MGRNKTPLVVLSVVVILTISNLIKSNGFVTIRTFEESNDINTPPPPPQRHAFTTLLAADIQSGDDSLTSGKNPSDSNIFNEMIHKEATAAQSPDQPPTKSRKTVPPPSYTQVTHVPSQRRRRSPSNLSSKTTRPDSISLVVGYWAKPGSFFTSTSIISSTSTYNTSTNSSSSKKHQPSYKRPHPHRAEIEAAMINNLHNPYIHQLVVVLDSISDEANCTHHFIPHMQRLSSLVQSEHPQYFEGASNQQLLQLPCTLTCIDRVEAQPTYLEMFQYSSSRTVVEGPVVLMANADQAFDGSLKLAAHLQLNAISVISTRGFDKTLVPPALLEPYITIVTRNEQGQDASKNIAQKTNVKITGNRCTKIKNKRRGTPSWDSFLFQRDMVAHGLDELDPNLFVRGEKHRIRYFMNEMGAENAALYDLTKALKQAAAAASRNNHDEPQTMLPIWNSCFLIQSWDFHLAAKIHKNRTETGVSSWASSRGVVPGPTGLPPTLCGSSMAKAVFDPKFVLDVEVPACRLKKPTTTTAKRRNKQAG